ncbi:hypothetical protein D3C86_2019800 [compost metagenome]
MPLALVVFVDHLHRYGCADVGNFAAADDSGDIQIHAVVVFLDRAIVGGFAGQGDARDSRQNP